MPFVNVSFLIPLSVFSNVPLKKEERGRVSFESLINRNLQFWLQAEQAELVFHSEHGLQMCTGVTVFIYHVSLICYHTKQCHSY